jgi:hypothetical protein
MLVCVPTERDHSSPTRGRVPPVEVREIASRFSVWCCDLSSYWVGSHGLLASAGGGIRGKYGGNPPEGSLIEWKGTSRLAERRRQVAVSCVVEVSGPKRPL